jgi:hypothetical protein
VQTLYIFINTYVYYEFTVVCIGILFIFKMQRQRVRVRRRAAATDLTVRDPEKCGTTIWSIEVNMTTIN